MGGGKCVIPDERMRVVRVQAAEHWLSRVVDPLALGVVVDVDRQEVARR